MTDDTRQALPPSFTPASGRTSRPTTSDGATEVGPGARPATGPAPVPPPPRSSRVTRQSSQPVPVRTSAPRPAAGAPAPARAASARSSTRSSGRAEPARPVRDHAATRSTVPPAAARPASAGPAGARSAGARSADARPAGARSAAAPDPAPGSAPRSYPPRPAGEAPTPRVARASGQRTAPRTAAATATAGAGTGGPTAPPSPDGGFRLRKGRIALVLAAVVVVALLAWPVGMLVWANGKIQHVEALSDHAATPGTTYLLAGSDSRSQDVDGEGSKIGARTDSIMLLHVPESGPTSLISIPRDTYATIPGHGAAKINAAFSFGGAPLLVRTVEQLTGMKVDHYVEIGFDGMKDLVDAVGGVRLCLDYDVDDKKSKLHWKAGCHTVDGTTALAFSRMRYSDPLGDFGRTARQRQVITAVTKKIADPGVLVRPGKQVALADAGLGVVKLDEQADILDVGRLAIAFRNATGSGGVTGQPPIGNPDYRPGGVGSTVQLDPDRAPQFWADVRDGKLAPGKVNTGKE